MVHFNCWVSEGTESVYLRKKRKTRVMNGQRFYCQRRNQLTATHETSRVTTDSFTRRELAHSKFIRLLGEQKG